MRIIASLVFLALAFQANQSTIMLRPGERWWGGAVNEGHKMPFGTTRYALDLYGTSVGNQCSPLLLSNQGRYVWCEKPFRFEFSGETLNVTHPYEPITLYENGKTLADAYRAAAARHFPPAGEMPDPVLFSRPQFNTWIELVYNQNQADILKYGHAVVDNGFPPGVLMIDDNWQRYYGNFEFKAERFPDAKAMVDELHQLGFKVMLWVCPFVSPDSAEFRKLKDEGLFLQERIGTRTRPQMIEWWNGFSAVLDFSNPAAVRWFDEQLSGLQKRYGIDGFKFDAGDTEYYPDSAVTHQQLLPNEHTELFGKIGVRYPLNEFRAMWKMGGQPLAERLRDKEHNWEDLQKLIPHTFIESLIGNSFTCPDLIGGGEYGSFLNLASYDQDLVVRSAQCQALMPMMQFSAAPWRVLDKPRLQAVKKVVETRQKFVPYILELAEKAARTGEPIVAPLEYHYPHQGYVEIKDQFMLGDRIIVAPVVEKNQPQKRVTLPPGKWKSDRGEIYDGGKVITVKTPIDRLPFFEKQ